MFGLTSIKVFWPNCVGMLRCMYITCSQGVGRRYANLVCKKADVDMNKRAGELNDEEASC